MSAEHIESAARRYVAAFRTACEVFGPPRNDALVLADMALHDLFVACGEPCMQCEGDTCPGIIGPFDWEPAPRVIDTPPL